MSIVREDILFLPLDIPLLDISLERVKRFGHIHENDKSFLERFCQTVVLRRAVNGQSRSVYNFYEDGLDWQWSKSAEEHFPDLIDHVENYLPFKKLTLLTWVSPKKMREVPPHMDYPPNATPRFVVKNEPYALRISIGNFANSFYVSTNAGTTDAELAEGRYHFGNKPDSTQAWAMNTTACFHNTLTRSDKETLFICGILDHERYDQLIERSVAKYAPYVVTKQCLKERGRPLSEVIQRPWYDLYERHPELLEH